eukprot:572402-Hanusia_phi.AAC.1
MFARGRRLPGRRRSAAGPLVVHFNELQCRPGTPDAVGVSRLLWTTCVLSAVPVYFPGEIQVSRMIRRTLSPRPSIDTDLAAPSLLDNSVRIKTRPGSARTDSVS